MDTERFDALLRAFRQTPVRRHVLRVLAGSTVGFLAGRGAAGHC